MARIGSTNGRLKEVEKCASELARVLGSMQKTSAVKSGKEEKVLVLTANCQCTGCLSYVNFYYHPTKGIIHGFCIRLKRSIYPEWYDNNHPKDCPSNKFRKLAGLKCR